MKTTIEVKDRREAALVQAGMEVPVVRALVLVTGALQSLPTDRARQRVLLYAKDKLDEEREDKGPSIETAKKLRDDAMKELTE